MRPTIPRSAGSQPWLRHPRTSSKYFRGEGRKRGSRLADFRSDFPRRSEADGAAVTASVAEGSRRDNDFLSGEIFSAPLGSPDPSEAYYARGG